MNTYFVAGHRVGGSAIPSADGRIRVVLYAPESVNNIEMEAIVHALRRDNTTVLAYRDDIRLHTEQVEAGCKGADQFILMAGDIASPRERQMILAARAGRIEKFTIICIDSCQALTRYRTLAHAGLLKLVVVRAQMEHHRIGQILGGRISHTFVAGDLVNSAREIAKAILGPEM